MPQPLLRKGDVIAIRAVVQFDQTDEDSPIYARLGGWRDVQAQPEEVHEVIERHFEVGDSVRVFPTDWRGPVRATVRAVVKDKVVVELESEDIEMVGRSYVERIAPPRPSDPTPPVETPPTVALDEPAPAPEPAVAEEVQF